MNDITALMATMKAAAESVIKNYGREWFETGCQICTVHKSKVNLISLANPVNVLELVEALENAQRQIQAHGRAEFTWLNALELPDDASRIDILPAIHAGKYALRDATKRIAELESRTVTVKLASRRLPSDFDDGEFGNDDLAAIHNACRLECKVSIEKYLSAHGIVVNWEAE